MLRHWSLDTLKQKLFVNSVTFTAQSWKLASNFLDSDSSMIKRIGSLDTFILLDKSQSCLINLDFINSRFNKLESDKDLSFDKLVSFQRGLSKVFLDRKNWSNSRCSCIFFFKNYYCFHIIALAVNQKLLTMPLKYNNKAIAPKAKAGRPAKAKKCLVRQ